MDEDYCTMQEAAARWGCSVRTIRNHIKWGYLKAVRVGPRMIRVDIQSLFDMKRPIVTATSHRRGTHN